MRTIFNPAQGWLLVLADYPPRGASVPDGLTDVYYYFRDITGTGGVEDGDSVRLGEQAGRS